MADDPQIRASRQRPSKMAASAASSLTSPPSSSSSSAQQRNPPHLPTPAEAAVLALYPALLVFGSVFALVSPQVRAAAYDAGAQSLRAADAPSYFARKDNLVNVLFVKRGWAWVSAAFAAFVLTHPHHTTNTTGRGGRQQSQQQHVLGSSRRLRAILRWALVTGWWVLVTQWCFGPPLIDRGFRYTGGKCEEAEQKVRDADYVSPADIFSAAACRTAGGRWRGGHDISGHVFLLVLGSFFLLQEAGWVAVRAWEGTSGGGRDPRAVVMADGAVKGVDVEADGRREDAAALGFGGRFVAGVVGLSMWMLLMTAIYFHTWFEKLTGLLVALIGLYGVYILPRSVPALRRVVGLPGI
ncbi:hypothetical protein RB595_000354 [Gaeumannomyces hyphopodioides]